MTPPQAGRMPPRPTAGPGDGRGPGGSQGWGLDRPSIASTRSDLLRPADEVEELVTIAGGVGPEARLGQLQDAGQGGVALVQRAAEEHAEAGDGGGELVVVAGGGVVLAGVLDAALEQLTCIALGLLVAELHEQGQRARRLGLGLRLGLR